jgi:hypothetical protein
MTPRSLHRVSCNPHSEGFKGPDSLLRFESSHRRMALRWSLATSEAILMAKAAFKVEIDKDPAQQQVKVHVGVASECDVVD